MFGMGPAELGILAGLVVILFGGSQLPKLGRGIGSFIGEMRGARRELQKAIDTGAAEAERPKVDRRMGEREG